MVACKEVAVYIPPGGLCDVNVGQELATPSLGLALSLSLLHEPATFVCGSGEIWFSRNTARVFRVLNAQEQLPRELFPDSRLYVAYLLKLHRM